MTDHFSPEKETPLWLNSEVLAEIAASLDVQLRYLLQHGSLYGSLGATLTQLMGVSKFDNIHEEGTLPEEQYGDVDKELTAITAQLSEELKQQLLKYGASEADVEFAVVRRWDMLAGSENACVWIDSVYSEEHGHWCAIKKCC